MFSLCARRLVGVALFVVLVAAIPLFAQTGGATGKCTGEDGKPLVGYVVLIERQEFKWASKVKTNKHGEYTYIGLAPGNYVFTLTDPNGRRVFDIKKHLSIGDPTEIDFDMAKERANARQEQQANPAYQKMVTEQAVEQKQYTGMKGLFDHGVALYEQQKYAEAAATFEKALLLAKEKNVPIILGHLADTYSKAATSETDRDAKAKDEGQALMYFQKAIAASPNDATVHNNLGSLYAEMGKTAEAQTEFQKAAELDPPGAYRYYYNLGVILYNKGKMDEAAAALKKATELDPSYAAAYYLQAQALLGKATLDADGNVVAVPGTIEALKTYLKLEPNGKWAQAAKDSLQLLTGKIQTQYKAVKKKKGG